MNARCDSIGIKKWPRIIEILPKQSMTLLTITWILSPSLHIIWPEKSVCCLIFNIGFYFLCLIKRKIVAVITYNSVLMVACAMPAHTLTNLPIYTLRLFALAMGNSNMLKRRIEKEETDWRKIERQNGRKQEMVCWWCIHRNGMEKWNVRDQYKSFQQHRSDIISSAIVSTNSLTKVL